MREAAKTRRAAGLAPVVASKDAERLLAEVPEDTRGLTAMLLGDPLPGRSALDRRSTPSE